MITSHIQTRSPAPAVVSTPEQDKVNRSVYHSPGVYRYYLSKLLTPPEIACLLKYQPCIAGRDVLDIGVGAGRTTRYLAPLARHYQGVDYSPVMVGYMRKTMREVNVDQADFRDLHNFDDHSFDFVFATDNVIDALAHEDRLRALSEACRVLRPDGILAFSSHNIRYKTAFAGPQFGRSSDPVRLAANCVRYVQSWWNYVHVAPLRKTTAEYALLNDPGHRYACLHYYASRSVVSSQLTRAGMALIEAFDRDGKIAPDGEDDSENPSLMYVAQRSHTR
jgi:SAM-dependent methyltransferase